MIKLCENLTQDIMTYLDNTVIYGDRSKLFDKYVISILTDKYGMLWNANDKLRTDHPLFYIIKKWFSNDVKKYIVLNYLLCYNIIDIMCYHDICIAMSNEERHQFMTMYHYELPKLQHLLCDNKFIIYII